MTNVNQEEAKAMVHAWTRVLCERGTQAQKDAVVDSLFDEIRCDPELRKHCLKDPEIATLYNDFLIRTGKDEVV